MWFLLLILLCCASQGWAIDNEPLNPLPDPNNATFGTKSRQFWQNELPDIFGKHFPGGWIYSGGLHSSVSSCTSAPFSTEAFTSAGNRVRAIEGNNPDSSSGPGAGSAIAINYTATGCNCAGSDMAWVIISGQSGDALGNFTRAAGSNYFVNCTDAQRPALPSDSAWLMGLTMDAGALATPTDLRTLAPGGPESANSHSATQLFTEMSFWWKDAFQSYVTEDCFHGVSATTSVVIQTCRAYIFSTLAAYIKETTPHTVTYSAGDGGYWLIAHTDTSSLFAGWNRMPGTRYLWQYTGTTASTGTVIYPIIPPNAILLARVIVSLGAITQIGDYRQDSPVVGEPINILSPLYGVVGDNITDDTVGIQMALNAASWQRRRTVRIPQSPRGDCYKYTKLWLGYEAIENPRWNTHVNSQGRVILTGDGMATVRDAKFAVYNFTCLRSTDPIGPAVNIISKTGGSNTNSQRAELRDLHFLANNTTSVIKMVGDAHSVWQQVSVKQENNTVGNGVEIEDSFLFLWEGGLVQGAITLPGSTGIGVKVSMPITPVAGLVEFRNMISQFWDTCWQYGNDVNENNRLQNLKFVQIEGKGCARAMQLYSSLHAVSLTDSYFEEYEKGITIAGDNRNVRIEGNYFGGTYVTGGKTSVDVGFAAAEGPKTARQVSVRLNAFIGVAVNTTGVRLNYQNAADNGREVSYNDFNGGGDYIEIVSDTDNLHQLRIEGNNYGVAGVPIRYSGAAIGRIDFHAQENFITTSRLQQRLISGTREILNTEGTLIFNSTSNLQRVRGTGGTVTILNLAFTEGVPVTGTEFCVVRDAGSQNLIFTEGGNIQLDGGANKSLTALGSMICFVRFSDEYFQSRGLVQQN